MAAVITKTSTRITITGAYKAFTGSSTTTLVAHSAGVLTQLDYVVGAVTTRKTFTYNPDGSLASITQEVL